MAKEIIVLETTVDANGNQNIRFAFWFAVSAGKQVPRPGFSSAYRGASSAESASLQAGTVVEQIGSAQYPNGTATATIQADLQSRWTAANTTFQALTSPNQFYGAFWDGTTWTGAPANPLPIDPSIYQTGATQISTSGDNTVISGTSGQVIAIYRMILIANGSVNVTIKDGASNTLLGPFSMTTGVPIVFDWAITGEPWFLTSAGNAFVINLSAAVAISIRGSYVKG